MLSKEMPSQQILQPSLLKCSVCVYEDKSNPNVTKTRFHTQILFGKFKYQTWFKKDIIKTSWKQNLTTKNKLLTKTGKSDNLILLLHVSFVVRWCFLLLWGVFSYFITIKKTPQFCTRTENGNLHSLRTVLS